MKYELASSSTEEGEVKESKFPYTKSHLQFYYYPLTTQFVGKNSVPNYLNYKNENCVTQKLKKDLKADYPYVQFNILDSNKPFFQNKFKFIGQMTWVENTKPLELLNVKSSYSKIKKPELRPNATNHYETFFKNFFFKKDPKQIYEFGSATKIFCLEDRVLEYIDSKEAFIFLRVKDEKYDNSPVLIKKYVFEDVFFRATTFYEFLEIYQQFLIKGHQCEEIRQFSNDDAMFYVYSNTVFRREGEIKRIFSTLDLPKNTKILLNKSGTQFHSIQGQITKNENLLLSLDLPEGDYSINDKKIYKLSKDGEYFEFKGVNYNDFLKSIWTI